MLIPAGAAQINLGFTGPGVPLGAETTFAVSIGDMTSPTEVKNAVMGAVGQSGIIGLCSGQTTVTSVRVKFGPNDYGPMALFPADVRGSGSSETLPPNVAMLIRKNTALGGRRAQGRMFLPGIPEAASGEGGILVPTYVGDAQNKFTALYTSLQAFEVPMLLLHSKDYGGLNALPVTALTVQATVATQRRRLRG